LTGNDALAILSGMEQITDIVKDIRMRLHLTQHNFGTLVGKSGTDIAKYELGYSNPPGDVLLRILYVGKRIKKQRKEAKIEIHE
jgi:transcriptional regulator with XRE-family HTH domain